MFFDGELMDEYGWGLRQGIEEYERRQRWNRQPTLSIAEYSDIPCGEHYDERVQAIIDTISSKPWSLFAGSAETTIYKGQKLEEEETLRFDVYRLRNGEEGFTVEFKINTEQPQANIHVLWFIVDKEQQGAYFKTKRLIGDIKALFLDQLGYGSMYGRAMWSGNTPARNKVPMEKDWRYQFRFMGWDSNLQPIYIEGLKALYLRMGWLVPPSDWSNDLSHNVWLPHDKTLKEIRSAGGDAALEEMTKFSDTNRSKWRSLCREREGRLLSAEIEERKRGALAECRRLRNKQKEAGIYV
jgi:hypothetical protein